MSMAIDQPGGDQPAVRRYAFGPPVLVPTLWLAPLDDPVRLLFLSIGLCSGLLSVSYAIGTVNRLREEMRDDVH